jgi:hypothetical protein
MSRLLEAVRTMGCPYEASSSGRWAKILLPGHTIYLQEYAWDNNCVRHYLVYHCCPDHPSEAQRFVSLEEALQHGVLPWLPRVPLRV